MHKLCTNAATWHFGGEDLVRAGTLERWLASQLENYVLARKNIPIAGGPGAGKTTLLNILGKFIPPEEWILLIETSRKFQWNMKTMFDSRPGCYRTACLR